jgi:hypothetical protein
MSAPSENLREVVREVLAELLEAPEQATRPALGRGNGHSTAETDRIITVTVRNDGDLRDLVLRVLALAEDPVRRQAMRAGQIRFRLATAADPEAPPGSGDRQTLRIDRGALTERTVAAAARDGQSIVLGKRAVATPLALDKARSLGISVRKEAT